MYTFSFFYCKNQSTRLRSSTKSLPYLFCLRIPVIIGRDDGNCLIASFASLLIAARSLGAMFEFDFLIDFESMSPFLALSAVNINSFSIQPCDVLKWTPSQAYLF